ncbi:ABC transporter ATP-binding protein [Bauldia litoralis]|uniref:ABC transporter ATP-binding protein n=2 Tax=Bauldia litoralis TaxID=665467 RepID=UPI003266B61C
MTDTPVLDVRDLKIAFGAGRKAREVVHGVSFTVQRGEVVAIVGESGSGKSVTALSLMGLLPRGHGAVTGGSAHFEETDLITLAPEPLRRIRGARIGMVFQEPMTSLNPVLTIGRQMTEGMMAHGRVSDRQAREAAIAMLERVGIDDGPRRLGQYPHEFSGGMRQRVMIAMAMMMKPALLIADEPTTALDVTIQAQILDLMRTLIAETGTSLILITHDMGVVAETADRVVVMHDGRVVEEADAKTLFAMPGQAYTRALLAAVPRLDGAVAGAVARPAGREPVVRIDAVSKTFGGRTGTRALDRVSLDVMAGEVVALVGESGSGKSTLGRAVARLLDVDDGAILVDGHNMAEMRGATLRRARARVQMIFQDPYASLDPRFSIGRTVAEPMLIHGGVGRREASERAAALLQRVGLDRPMARRFPHEFSGGQRQRVAIARALAAGPKIIVADEPTSALDVTIQAQVLDLLAELRDEQGIALLFISHDLAVVRQISSRVAVMRSGRLLEMGPTEAVLGSPRHAYTRALLSAAPVPDPAKRGRVRVTVAAGSYPDGPLVEAAPGHWVAS